MNKFETDFIGKVPIFLDDLRFMDGIFRNIILRMAQGFGVSRFGADYLFNELSQTYNVNPGVIIIEDELFYFPGGSIAGGNQDRIAFGVLETKSGNRVTGNSVPIQCYTNRTAYLVNMDTTVYTGDYTWLDENSAGKRFEPAFIKNTAFNKKFGNQAGNVPEINSSLGPNMVVITANNTKLNTENRGSAFNKSFGTNADTVSEGNHNHLNVYEPVFTKNSAFNKDFAGTGSASTVARSDHSHDGTLTYVVPINHWTIDTNWHLRKRTIGNSIHITGFIGAGTISVEAFSVGQTILRQHMFTILCIDGGYNQMKVNTDGTVEFQRSVGMFLNVMIPINY